MNAKKYINAMYWRFILVSIIMCSLSACGGKNQDKNDEINPVNLVNDAIQNANFADAYDIIDKIYLGEYNGFSSSDAAKLNSKALSSEIQYLLGEDLDSGIKSGKIILTIKQRAKYNDDWYSQGNIYYEKRLLENQKDLFETSILTAQSLSQKEVATKLQVALNQVNESLNKAEKEMKAEEEKRERDRKEREEKEKQEAAKAVQEEKKKSKSTSEVIDDAVNKFSEWLDE